jgi:hypothetical protein
VETAKSPADADTADATFSALSGTKKFAVARVGFQIMLLAWTGSKPFH